MRIKNFVQLFAAAAALTLTLSMGVTALAVSNNNTNTSATVYYKITREGTTVPRVYDVSLGTTSYTIEGTQYVVESIDADGKIVTKTTDHWNDKGVTITNNGNLAVHVALEFNDGAISLTANKGKDGTDLAPRSSFTVDITSKSSMEGLTMDGKTHEAGSITLVLSEISETNS